MLIVLTIVSAGPEKEINKKNKGILAGKVLLVNDLVKGCMDRGYG